MWDTEAFLSSAEEEQLCDTGPAFPVTKDTCELCSWLQSWQTKTLSDWCKGKALPVLRASKLSSSPLQNTAMAQSTCIIYHSRLLSDKLWRKSQERWWGHDSTPWWHHRLPWAGSSCWIIGSGDTSHYCFLSFFFFSQNSKAFWYCQTPNSDLQNHIRNIQGCKHRGFSWLTSEAVAAFSSPW